MTNVERGNPSRLPYVGSLLSLVFCILSNIIVSSQFILASTTHRNNYNAYNYDRMTPQFTPDGRLLQVEYASSAASLSPPLVVLECYSPMSKSNADSHLILLTIPKANCLQNRIVILEDRDDQLEYCCVMSGILSDSLCLLKAGMKVAAEYSLRYQSSLGMVALTQALADECQSRVFSGGLRPYGSTMLMCGFDGMYGREIISEGDDQISASRKNNNNNINYHIRPSIYQTDPSGGIIQHYTQSKDSKLGSHQRTKSRRYKKKHDDDANIIQSEVRCIVGGSQSLQRQLYKRINQGMAKFEEQQRRSRQVWSLSGRIANLAKILTNEMDNDKRAIVNKSRNNDSSSSNLGQMMEIVVISSRLGCHRLDKNQIQAIEQLIK